jgi:hypothetical protein
MFLVRHASEVMHKDVLVLPGAMSFDEFCAGPSTAARCATPWSPMGRGSSACSGSNTGLRRGLESA